MASAATLAFLSRLASRPVSRLALQPVSQLGLRLAHSASAKTAAHETTLNTQIPEIPRVDRTGEALEAKRGRLRWSTRHRGILETDLLLSTFAKLRLDGMSAAELAEFDSLCDESDWDLYYWATEASPAPPRVASLSIWADLVEHTKNRGRETRTMPAL